MLNEEYNQQMSYNFIGFVQASLTDSTYEYFNNCVWILNFSLNLWSENFQKSLMLE